MGVGVKKSPAEQAMKTFLALKKDKIEKTQNEIQRIASRINSIQSEELSKSSSMFNLSSQNPLRNEESKIDFSSGSGGIPNQNAQSAPEINRLPQIVNASDLV